MFASAVRAPMISSAEGRLHEVAAGVEGQQWACVHTAPVLLLDITSAPPLCRPALPPPTPRAANAHKPSTMQTPNLG